MASATVALLCTAGCADSPAALAPAGRVAAAIANLTWVLFTAAAVVYAIVVALLVLALVRRRRREAVEPPRGADPVALVVVSGFVIPVVMLVPILAYSLNHMATLAAPPTPPRLTVLVIGHQWWWEIRYQGQQVVTANELHVPVAEPVRIDLSSDDVIHSFWVPQLMGKMDLIPGKTNTTWLQADEPGIFRGQCAEFCGLQHAKMALLVEAQPAEEFAAWLEAQRQPSAEPSDPLEERGASAFARLGCIGCHSVRTGAAEVGGANGPDLTHVASRHTLAAGTLQNTRGNLAGWIADPQAIKPGNKMPDLNPDPATLQALVAYLESLR